MQDNRSGGRAPGKVRGGRRRAGLFAVAAVTAAACTTTAWLVPINRALTEVESPGFRTLDTCDAERSDTEVVLRFVGGDAAGSVLLDGERFGSGDNRDVVRTDGANANFTWESIVFRNARLYPSPDVPCESDGDCAAAGLSGFTCEPVNPGDAVAGVRTVCGQVISPAESVNRVQASLEFSGVVGAEAQPQLIAVGVFDGSTIHGLVDPDEPNRLPGREARPDPDVVRATMLETGVREFLLTGGTGSAAAETVRPVGEGFLRGSGLCLALFRGQERDPLLYFPDRDTCFFSVQDRETVDQAMSRFNAERFIDFQDEVGRSRVGGRNVWWAASQLLDVLEQQQQQLVANPPRGQAVAAPALHLVLFVDGASDPQTLFENPESAESVTVRAQELGAQVHILHLDRPYDCGPEPRCAAPGPRPYTGPIDEFAQIACATRGTYQYTREASTLEGMFRAMARTLARSYEVTFDLQSVLSRTDVPRGAYTMSGEMVLRIGRSESQVTVFGGEVGVERADRRVPVFKRPFAPREPAPGGGGVSGPSGGSSEAPSPDPTPGGGGAEPSGPGSTPENGSEPVPSGGSGGADSAAEEN